MDLQDRSFGINVSYREGQEGVLHVERCPVSKGENKQHPLVLGHLFPEHHARGNLHGTQRDFRHQFLGSQPEFHCAQTRQRMFEMDRVPACLGRWLVRCRGARRRRAWALSAPAIHAQADNHRRAPPTVHGPTLEDAPPIFNLRFVLASPCSCQHTPLVPGPVHWCMTLVR